MKLISYWMIILNASGCLKLQPKESTYQISLSHELVDLIGNSSLGIGTRLKPQANWKAPQAHITSNNTKCTQMWQ